MYVIILNHHHHQQYHHQSSSLISLSFELCENNKLLDFYLQANINNLLDFSALERIFGKYDMYGRIQDIQMSTTIKYIQDFFKEDIKTIIEKQKDLLMMLQRPKQLAQN